MRDDEETYFFFLNFVIIEKRIGIKLKKNTFNGSLL